MKTLVDFGIRWNLCLLIVVVLLPGRALGQGNPLLSTLPGETATLISDGRWLVAGGIGPSGVQKQAAIIDTSAQTVVPIPGGLLRARAGHTSTVLPDGTVLILGGMDAQGLVETPELFDPSASVFRPLFMNGPSPRAYHTATLLTDGTVLIAGGISSGNDPLQSAEVWNRQTGTTTYLQSTLSVGRRSQSAVLLASGGVWLSGGFDQANRPLRNGDLYDPTLQAFAAMDAPPSQNSTIPRLEASIPADGGADIPVSTVIALRFSQALNVETVNAATISLQDESQTKVSIKIVAAEGGMLAFLIPEVRLQPSSTYSVATNGLIDATGQPAASANFAFTTSDAISADPTSIGWKRTALDGTKEPDALPALQAPKSVTALSGRVLRSNNAQPLAAVSLTLGCNGTTKTARTDSTGRFLISVVPAGHCKLEIDGTTTARKDITYGTYFVGVDLTAGQTNVLPYFIWLTQLDTSHANAIPLPTTAETIVSTPLLPGLELHLHPNTVVTDYSGTTVKRISITPIPLGRTPFPLPNVAVDFYFTVQPGGGYIKVGGNGVQGATLIYPNSVHAPAGTRFDFWNYDPDLKGWYIYGQGSVSADQRSIVPDPGVVLYSFTGAMATTTGSATGPAKNGPNSGCKKPGCKGGDPLDLGTGLFAYEKTDLTLPGVMPIVLKRTYRQGDNVSRAFGIGASHDYNVFLSGPDANSPSPYSFMDLILADGGRIHYPAIANAGNYLTVIFEHTGTQTPFYKSHITYNGAGWTLKFKDGTVWTFPEGFQKTSLQSGLASVTDRNGNTLTMTRDSGTGNLNRITSSSGRWISLTYDATSRITQAQDNSGRTVAYAYDTGGRLSTVTDANGGTTRFTYDPNSEMMTITDPRNITYLTNFYDGNGRVVEQDQADGGTFHFAYTLDQNGNVTQTDVTNPRGYVERSSFDTSGYLSGGNLLTWTRALGHTEQQTVSYQYDPTGTGLLVNTTDALGRETTFSYDSSGCGNLTGITRLYGTANAVTTTMAYQTGSGTYPCLATFNLLTSITDPLSHATTFGYNTYGNLTSVTDALSHSTTIVPNTAGQPTSFTNFAGTAQFAYASGDLVSITDPTSYTTTRTVDLAGRLVGLQAPLGQAVQYQYDALNDLVKIIDPLGGQTNLAYDNNGNLLTVRDANSNTTTYTPNTMDRVGSRQDALLNQETYQYDLNGNLSVFTDRKNQVTQYTYDGLDRRTQIQYADLSTAAYTYDAGNRVTQVVDSVSGTITRGYDGLDRLTSEATPQGSISYTYDSAGRRASMTVAGQTAVNYTFDNANRLTQIAQGSATVALGYDNANRRTSLTLPNGVVVAYGFDAASRVTSITYTNGSTTIGTLTYTHDANGRRTSMGGTLAAVNLPSAVSSATYNANNQLTAWGSATLTYDANGNLTNDGTTSYTWDARNHLGAFGSTSFSYDSFGRRTLNPTGTSFVYDGVNPVQELSGSTVTANLLTGLGVDEIFTRTDSTATRNFLADGLGSTVALTDSSGTVQTQYSYEPFGKTTASGSSNSDTYQYTGRENDGTGLYYYRARYYHPTLGRFVSEDPLRFGGGDTSFYVYAGDDPISFSDPSGGKPRDPYKGGPDRRGGSATPGAPGSPAGPGSSPDNPSRPGQPPAPPDDGCQSARDRRDDLHQVNDWLEHHMLAIGLAGAALGAVGGAASGFADFGVSAVPGAYIGAHFGLVTTVSIAHFGELTLLVAENWPMSSGCPQ